MLASDNEISELESEAKNFYSDKYSYLNNFSPIILSKEEKNYHTEMTKLEGFFRLRIENRKIAKKEKKKNEREKYFEFLKTNTIYFNELENLMGPDNKYEYPDNDYEYESDKNNKVISFIPQKNNYVKNVNQKNESITNKVSYNSFSQGKRGKTMEIKSPSNLKSEFDFDNESLISSLNISEDDNYFVNKNFDKYIDEGTSKLFYFNFILFTAEQNNRFSSDIYLNKNYANFFTCSEKSEIFLSDLLERPIYTRKNKLKENLISVMKDVKKEFLNKKKSLEGNIFETSINIINQKKVSNSVFESVSPQIKASETVEANKKVNEKNVFIMKNNQVIENRIVKEENNENLEENRLRSYIDKVISEFPNLSEKILNISERSDMKYEQKVGMIKTFYNIERQKR